MNKAVVIARESSVTENIARGIHGVDIDLRKASLFDKRDQPLNDWKVHLDGNTLAIISDNHLSTDELTSVIQEAARRGVRQFLVVEHKRSEGLPEAIRIPRISSGDSFATLNAAVRNEMGLLWPTSTVARKLG